MWGVGYKMWVIRKRVGAIGRDYPPTRARTYTHLRAPCPYSCRRYTPAGRSMRASLRTMEETIGFMEDRALLSAVALVGCCAALLLSLSSCVIVSTLKIRQRAEKAR